MQIFFSDLRSWWEVPSIAHFCSLFRSAFDLTDFDIEVCIISCQKSKLLHMYAHSLMDDCFWSCCQNCVLSVIQFVSIFSSIFSFIHLLSRGRNFMVLTWLSPPWHVHSLTCNISFTTLLHIFHDFGSSWSTSFCAVHKIFGNLHHCQKCLLKCF